MPHAPEPYLIDLPLPDAEATTRLGHALSVVLQPGDTVLLEGPIGAGKSHLARAIIKHRLAQEHRVEDVPSPTFTLVQTYETARAEIWHADLYRLSDPDEVIELGFDTAFQTAICLIEWPDRLGADRPNHALTIALSAVGAGRIARMHGPGDWAERLSNVVEGTAK